MRTVTTDSAIAEQQSFEELPERVREALGELAGAASEGLMALSVGVGLGVLHELMEAEVEEVVGPKGRHDPERTAVRHGHEPTSVTLGARRVPVSRPRVRSADEKRELPLETFSPGGPSGVRTPSRRRGRVPPPRSADPTRAQAERRARAAPGGTSSV
jgi:hypothetical protein